MIRTTPRSTSAVRKTCALKTALSQIKGGSRTRPFLCPSGSRCRWLLPRTFRRVSRSRARNHQTERARRFPKKPQESPRKLQRLPAPERSILPIAQQTACRRALTQRLKGVGHGQAERNTSEHRKNLG